VSQSNNPDASLTERRISRLGVPELGGFAPNERIDWIHDPDQQLRDLTERPR